MPSKANWMFHTFATGALERRKQYIRFSGRATPTNRLDLQRLMGDVGFPSKIIEVDGGLSKDQAYDLAKDYARRFGLPVITDKENLEHMQKVNKETDVHSKVILSGIRKMHIPKDLQENLIKSAKDTIEEWCGWQQEYTP